MALPDGVGWFGTPDALVDDYFDVLSPSACKFLWLLLRLTAGYMSYQDHPVPLRLSTREIREGRQSKAGTKLGKGSKQSKHTIIEAIRECEDLGLIYTEEDRSDLARIEKRYALLNPGCLGPYCTLKGIIQVDLWCGSYQPRQPVCKICTSTPAVNDDQICYDCLSDVQKMHSDVQKSHSTGQKLHTGGAEIAQRSYRDSLHKELKIEETQRKDTPAPSGSDAPIHTSARASGGDTSLQASMKAGSLPTREQQGNQTARGEDKRLDDSARKQQQETAERRTVERAAQDLDALQQRLAEQHALQALLAEQQRLQALRPGERGWGAAQQRLRAIAPEMARLQALAERQAEAMSGPERAASADDAEPPVERRSPPAQRPLRRVGDPPASEAADPEQISRRQRLMQLQGELAHLKKTPSMQLLARQRIPRLETEIKRLIAEMQASA